MMTPQVDSMCNNNDSKLKTPSTIDSLNKFTSPNEDPLTKFTKPKEDPNKRVQGSLNFLKQFGVNPASDNAGTIESSQKSNSDEKKDLFSIPPFKPKETSKSLCDNILENKLPVEAKKERKKSIEMLIPEIPPFNKSRSINEKVKEIQSKEVIIEARHACPTDSVRTNVERLTIPIEEIKTTTKPKRLMYAKMQNRLSVIQEEIKQIKDFVPTEQSPLSPYLNNLVINADLQVLLYETKTISSINEDMNKNEFLIRMQKYNDEILKALSNHKRKRSNKIDWMKLNEGKNYSIILNERKMKIPLSYLEKLFQIMIYNMDRNRIIKLIQQNSQVFRNQLKLNTMRLKKETLEEIKESDEYPISDYKKRGQSESVYSSYLSDSRSNSETYSRDYSSNDDSSCTSESLDPKELANNRDIQVDINIIDTSRKIKDTKKNKSKFGSKADFIEISKKFISEIENKPSSKNLNRFEKEITAYGFIKGNNTVPLVSDLLA